MIDTPRVSAKYFWAGLLMVATLLACAPAKDSGLTKATASKLLGNWQGTDPVDQSNIGLQISAEGDQFTVTANDDKTTSDWCGVNATATATASLDANQALNVNLLWVCNNRDKTSRGFPTVITYGSSDDSITAFGVKFTRSK